MKILSYLKNKLLTKRFFSLCCVLLSLTGIFYISNKRMYANHSELINDIGVEYEVKSLKQGDYLIEDFICPFNSIYGIDLYTSLPESETNMNINLIFLDRNNNVLYSNDFNINKINSFGVLEIKFQEPIKNCKDMELKMKITNKSDNINDLSLISSLDSHNIKFAISTSDLTNISIFYKYISVILFSFISISFYILLYGKISLNKIYFISVILFGIIFSILIPCGSVPDEIGHYYTAYHYSNRFLFINDPSDGINMRHDDYNTHFYTINNNKNTINEYLEKINTPISNNKIEKTNLTPINVNNYRYTYYPAAIGITLGRILDLGTYQIFMLGRLFNLFIFAILSTFALKNIPAYKSILFFVGLLPITLQQAASLSYDAMTIALALIQVAFTVKLFYHNYLSKKDRIILCITSFLLFFCKQFAYSILAISPFLFYIKKIKLKNVIKKYKKIVLFLIPTIILLGTIVLGIIISYSCTFDKSSILYLFSHPIYFYDLFIETLYIYFSYYVRGMLCSPLGSLDVHIHEFIVFCYISVMCLLISRNKENIHSFPTKMRIWYLFTVFITIFCMIVAMYSWSNSRFPDSTNIIGVQGRYFIPLIAPALIGIYKYGYIEFDNRELKLCYISVFLVFFEIIYLFLLYV